MFKRFTSRIMVGKKHRFKWMIVFSGFILFVIWATGLDLMIREIPYSKFAYPLIIEDDEFVNIVTNFREKSTLAITPTNDFYSNITFLPSKSDIEECVHSDTHFYLLILVKSAPNNFRKRDAIRQTWKNPVVGISTKTTFFIGNTNDILVENSLLEESSQSQDIVRINHAEGYYFNTVKTVMAMKYAAELCSNFEYAIFIDDDYYLSVSNLHQFTQEHSSTYRLYAGYTFFSKPLRHRFRNKWFIDLNEYPFTYFPRFVNAGNILLSKSALLDIYYATFFVKPFRFDDVYVAICAKKMGIEPIHSDRFKFWEEYGDQPRPGLIAAHGYDPDRLLMYWRIQQEAGYA